MTVDYAKMLEGMREAQSRPRYTGPTINVAHYWRPSTRHKWRLSSTRINVPDVHPDHPRLPVTYRSKADGSEEAEIPYDWEIWTPPARARALPGLAATGMVSSTARVEGYDFDAIHRIMDED